MDFLRALVAGFSLLIALPALAAPAPPFEGNPLEMPSVGFCQLQILTPTMLELTLVTTKKPEPAAVQQWNFVDADGKVHLPGPQEFVVRADEQILPVQTVGFKRRVLYAPFKHYDLRIGNYLYLQLKEAVPVNVTVDVQNVSHKSWSTDMQFRAKADPLRWSPVVHVNQTGYLPGCPKRAMVGYYLGSLGELDLEAFNRIDDSPPGKSGPASLIFQLLDAASGHEVFRGALRPRQEQGFDFSTYQRVCEADFTDFKTPGEYCLYVPGLGTSFPFRIDEGIAGAFARTYALGIYHQRCGTANELPFTRFTHGPCHTAPAEVPNSSSQFASVNDSLAKESADYKENPRHTAPQLKNADASLYPFVNPGPIDVRGGHHDAGDYSKYTVNSACFIHQLVFAVDVFPGVAELDNLGLPESGDGKSDLLQEAKWEADFLVKMQDADGAFYFLVYPRDREYEIDVTPDHGDPQVVFPKTTAATAASVAALAQCASSPTFKKQFPEAAALYLEKAKKGWSFIQQAITRYGRDGAYQKITHYGNQFMHDDELAWAACELFLATGDQAYQKKLTDWLHPSDPATRIWGWMRLSEAYGCAIRSYAFAVQAGKAKRDQLDPLLLDQCQAEVAAAGADQLRRAEQSAYGTSFPEESKRARTAGWYFSGDAAFDLAVAYQLDYPIMNDPRPRILDALLSNLNYEQGCNPVNVTYLTGLGWKRQREIVHQYAQNDRRVLPPIGIPLGNIQAGFGWLEIYGKDLGALSFPSDGSAEAPYPFYDRWGDSFNLTQEFVAVNQARALGYLAWLMARTSLKSQKWRSADGRIVALPKPSAPGKLSFVLVARDVDLSSARFVWEADGQEPAFGRIFSFTPSHGSSQWVEAEAQLPDGRRVFGVLNSLPH